MTAAVTDAVATAAAVKSPADVLTTAVAMAAAATTAAKLPADARTVAAKPAADVLPLAAARRSVSAS